VRLAAYITMVVLVLAAVASGQLALALTAGGLKTMLVGVEFMELRHAARAHLVAFVVGAAALTGLLVALTL
jgi:hypothetical protein